MKNLKICFIGTDPTFNGGMSLYQKNLIKYIQRSNSKINITWIYFGKKNEEFKKDNVTYIKIKNNFPYPLDQIIDNFRVLKFLRKRDFDIINSHALWGYWMKFYNPKKNQMLIHTYHGVTYNFFKNHLKRFSFFRQVIISPMLLFSYFIEKPPMKKSDNIICVSNKVKRQIEDLYGRKDNLVVIRTGVDVKDFRVRNKLDVRKNLKLELNKIYGLYIGKGGYWTKGLDRAVKLGEEIYKINNNFRLIVIGADYKKVKNIIEKKDFIIFKENVPREEISLHYSASDIFFCLSRYEGGAPTLVVSEAMASGCLLVCSKDSEQEIIKDKRNSIIIEKFDKNDAEKVLNIQNNILLKEKIIKNSMKTIKELSLEKWGKKYLKVILG